MVYEEKTGKSKPTLKDFEEQTSPQKKAVERLSENLSRTL